MPPEDDDESWVSTCPHRIRVQERRLQYAIQLQLLGGIWISQTIPSVIVGLYTRWLNPWALLIGWAAGLICGTWMAGTTGFQSATYPLQLDGLAISGYAALYALSLNFALCLLLSPIFNRMAATMGTDETALTDYRLGLRSGDRRAIIPNSV